MNADTQQNITDGAEKKVEKKNDVLPASLAVNGKRVIPPNPIHGINDIVLVQSKFGSWIYKVTFQRSDGRVTMIPVGPNVLPPQPKVETPVDVVNVQEKKVDEAQATQ
jgi:hypothetical protein